MKKFFIYLVYFIAILLNIWFFYTQLELNVLFNILGIIIWLSLLIIWWDSLVDGASSIWKKLNVSLLVIWLLIVSLWTSIPELIINIISASKNEFDLVFANIIWSNISNTFLIFWLSFILADIFFPKYIRKTYIPLSIFLPSLLFILLYIDPVLTRLNWFIFLIIFIYFVYIIYKLILSWKVKLDADVPEYSYNKSFLLIFLWILALFLWWDLAVKSSINFAEQLWISKIFVWAIILAIWSSLPELVTSLIAVYKKYSDMIVWNIIWSNIINIWLILSLSALYKPLNFNESMYWDIRFLILWTFSLIILLYLSKTKKLWKMSWIFMLLIYLAYILFVFVRM